MADATLTAIVFEQYPLLIARRNQPARNKDLAAHLDAQLAAKPPGVVTAAILLPCR